MACIMNVVGHYVRIVSLLTEVKGSRHALSPSALSWFLALQRKTYEDLIQYPLPRKTAGEIARVMEQYIAYYLERRPASLKFIDRSEI